MSSLIRLTARDHPHALKFLADCLVDRREANDGRTSNSSVGSPASSFALRWLSPIVEPSTVDRAAHADCGRIQAVRPNGPLRRYGIR